MSEIRNYYETITDKVIPDVVSLSQKREEKEMTNRNGGSGGSSGSRTTTTCARAIMKETDFDEDEKRYLLEEYRTVFGTEMPFPMKRYLTRLARMGMTFETVMNAIDETAFAKYPTPRYLMAILNRYADSGIFTGADVQRDKEEHERRMAARCNAKWSKVADNDTEDSGW